MMKGNLRRTEIGTQTNEKIMFIHDEAEERATVMDNHDEKGTAIAQNGSRNPILSSFRTVHNERTFKRLHS